ncbi:carbamoyltransferase C-terminal domain-containing protein [Comamonas testosteroni]|uniref:carbamoyltransferase C-terminal domain-containing protein n=1 Tax=Comamonas testosteroni TaxID=285 RepID=UPI0026E9EBE4|nr:carbamoyltransferase C-terminal domain-containing protein [Comamonas testosteroni]WQD42159.1 carbamoyltransferase C-terminal domain-containing protein [Comamonas testosteroni]
MKGNDIQVLGIKPGHDGAIAYIKEDVLQFSFEGEKDNGYRYSEATYETLLKSLRACNRVPDVIATGGWSEGIDPNGAKIEAGYCGINDFNIEYRSFLGSNAIHFSSSHERSHILCAYGSSPFPQGKPCYALIWVGYIGAIYYIDEKLKIKKIKDVLFGPGVRYAFLYAVADPSFDLQRKGIRLGDAGKLMALSGYAQNVTSCPDALKLVNSILAQNIEPGNLKKLDFRHSKYFNCGVTSVEFAGLAKLLSERIFELFHNEFSRIIQEKYPLLIAGGCGLNCEWNSRWIDSGLFSDVFIPPCANDSGSAIGTAIDAMHHFTGRAKVRWSVYCGEEPLEDTSSYSEFEASKYDAGKVAELLKDGKILGWVKGRYEIGPRSLGNRAILASPSDPAMLIRLNRLKKRESFRPIAPVCLEEDLSKYFFPAVPSPYMLEFRKVISDKIPAVTHVDRSARPQSVSMAKNADIYNLLRSFKQLTGISVLCNTSLNFNGKGFINRLSDMVRFASDNKLDGFVFNDRLFVMKEFK